MNRYDLDRMALDDAGLNPRRLAEAIHGQLGADALRVPVKEIALALDIDDIFETPLYGVEAALLAPPERGYGVIVVNSNSDRRRRRFSIAHELLHFLNDTHAQTDAGGFVCTQRDMTESGRFGSNRHVRQEMEANTFAIELLAPRSTLRPYIRKLPDLANVVAAAGDFDISREAMARRYVELHDDNLAVVFCKNQRMIYWSAGAHFPKLAIQSDQQCELGKRGEGISEMDEVRADDWLAPEFRKFTLSAQTLWQRNGHSMTLLHAIEPEDDDPGFDDAYDRLADR